MVGILKNASEPTNRTTGVSKIAGAILTFQCTPRLMLIVGASVGTCSQWLLHGVHRIARLRDADLIVDGEKLRKEARRGYAETRKKRLEIKKWRNRRSRKPG